MSEKNNEVSKIIEAVKNDGGEFVTSDKFEKKCSKNDTCPPSKR